MGTKTKVPTLREACKDVLETVRLLRTGLPAEAVSIGLENIEGVLDAALARDEKARVVNREMVAVLSTVQQVLIAHGFGGLDQNPQGIHDLVGGVLGRARELVD